MPYLQKELLAGYHIALIKGTDVDQPRNQESSKVSYGERC